MNSDNDAWDNARFSGPKRINLDGKLLGNFQLKGTTTGGKFTGCATLEYISKALTKDVLKWFKNPQIIAVPASALEPAPAEAAK